MRKEPVVPPFTTKVSDDEEWVMVVDANGRELDSDEIAALLNAHADVRHGDATLEPKAFALPDLDGPTPCTDNLVGNVIGRMLVVDPAYTYARRLIEHAEAMERLFWRERKSSVGLTGLLAKARSATDARTWQPMLTAPLDGTEIEIMFRHHTYWTALKVDGREKAESEWQAVQRAKWIDHNGGGWTWNGMAGYPVAWRPCA